MGLHEAEKLWEGVRLPTPFSSLCHSAERELGAVESRLSKRNKLLAALGAYRKSPTKPAGCFFASVNCFLAN